MSVTKHAAAILALGAWFGSAQSQAGTEKTEKKNITFIAAESSADGGSEVRRELVKDCILDLPNPDRLEPQVTSTAVFLQGVNGEADRKEWVKTYTAKLDVNYLNYQKEILIVTTRSVQGQEPVIKEVEKKLRRKETFASNPAEGDAFAGRSDRQYYFTKPENAAKDVKARAKIWIQQQAPVMCPEK